MNNENWYNVFDRKTKKNIDSGYPIRHFGKQLIYDKCPSCKKSGINTEVHCSNCGYYETSEDFDDVGNCNAFARLTKANYYDCAFWTCAECHEHYDRLETEEE